MGMPFIPCKYRSFHPDITNEEFYVIIECLWTRFSTYTNTHTSGITGLQQLHTSTADAWETLNLLITLAFGELLQPFSIAGRIAIQQRRWGQKEVGPRVAPYESNNSHLRDPKSVLQTYVLDSCTLALRYIYLRKSYTGLCQREVYNAFSA